MQSTLMTMMISDVNDPDEPFMDGNDDDFSDLEQEDYFSDLDGEDDDGNIATTSHSPPVSFPACASTTTATPGTLPAMWTTTIIPFQSAVGPNSPCTRLATGSFLVVLYCTPLLQMIMDESNR